jgi:hypothetical protein
MNQSLVFQRTPLRSTSWNNRRDDVSAGAIRTAGKLGRGFVSAYWQAEIYTALSSCSVDRVGWCNEEIEIYHGHRIPAGVIGCAVRWYFRFQLSLRDVEESLFVRGVIVMYAPKEVPWGRDDPVLV